VDVFPSPKSHAHEVGDPVEMSVKFTDRGAVPLVGVAEKSVVRAIIPTLSLKYVNSFNHLF